MKHSVKRLALGVLTAGVLLLAGRVGYSQDMPCDQLIVDKAGVLGNTSEIEKAAESLTKIGATVRVRTVPTWIGHGSLDHYEAELERACPSWQTPGGGTRNSLIVIMIAVQDRETGLYSGDQWRHVVRPHWDNIQSRFMNPRFRDGDYAGGFVAGLLELGRLVEESELHSGSGTVVKTDFSGCSNVGFGLLILVALVLLVLGGTLWYRKRENLRTARSAARGKKQSAAGRINDLYGELPVIKAKVNGIGKQMDEESDRALRTLFSEIETRFGKNSSRYNDLGKGAVNPEQDGRTLKEYESAASEYGQLASDLTFVTGMVSGLKQRLEEAEQAMAAAPAKIEQAEAAMVATGDMIAIATKDGWKTGDADNQHGEARQMLADARAALAAKNAGRAHALAEQAAIRADTVRRSVTSLPQKKAEFDQAIQGLTELVHRIGDTISGGRAAFERVSAKYAESSWQSIAGNGSKAEELVERANQLCNAARVAVSMQEQRWSDAETAYTEASKATGRAEQLIRAIAELERGLKEAEVQAPREIEAAQADIVRAQEYERAHDADIDDAMKEEIRQVEATFAQAREEMAKPQPDYFTVIKHARAANEHADNILATSRTQHETAERLRVKTLNAITTARTAVSRAENYIKSHSDDVDDDARGKLKRAKMDLTAAESADVAQQRLVHAEEAERLAKAAYKHAQANVVAAEEEDDGGDLGGLAIGIALGAMSSGGGSSHRSSGGGGGGISFGGGGGGRSGGSSSWGSGGGRSGGSSKW